MQQTRKRVAVEKTDGNVQRLQIEELATNPHIARMLELLTDEAGFLVETKVRKALEGVERDEAELMRVDAILKALGVETEEAVGKLMQYFVQEEDDEAAGTEMISSDDAVRAVRAFLQEMQHDDHKVFTRTEPLAAEGEEKKPRHKDSRDIWEVSGTVIAPKTFRVWGALERFLQKYNLLLTERARSIGDCEAMRTQNMELKMLLNQYLSSKINHELYVPPTATIGRLARP